jgi:hypothetical protein
MSKFKVAFLVSLASLSAVVVNTAESGHVNIPLIRVGRDSTLKEKLKGDPGATHDNTRYVESDLR